MSGQEKIRVTNENFQAIRKSIVDTFSNAIYIQTELDEVLPKKMREEWIEGILKKEFDRVLKNVKNDSKRVSG